MWKHILLLAVGITLASSATLYFKPLPKKQDVTLQDLMKIWAEKSAQNKQKTPLGSVSCQDGSDCPSSSTCCTMGNGHYGCCPLSHAVCCSDQIHCCPKDTTCDVKEGHCLKHDGSKVLWTQKTETQSVSSKNQVCPDGKTCPDGADCCVTTPGHYGCCFGEHQAPAKPVEEVVCPDGTSECADGETCCKLSTGEYGCCPLPNAVCCADHLHCCPSGTTCDTAQGKCNRQDGTSVMWFTKTSAKKSVSVESVTCPDGASQCPDGSTCCVLGSGQYGCCPLPKAVCCSDRIHCCPSGTTCDTSQGKCNRQDGTSVLWSEKTPAKSVSVEDVTCPDGQSQCPDGSTCCKLSSGQYGCCPLPNAVCCADHLHCCPSGTTCDTAQGKCNRQDGTSVLWSEKTPAKSVSVEDVVCPDGQSQCPDGSTCCKLSSGQYGCCPLPNAICCADHLHCCPSGTTCDTAQGKCNRQDGTSVMWFTKTSAKKSVSVESVMCPDGQSQCPDGSTCCKLSSGQYGCCPLPNAVCCADHLHCCPSGTTCDTAQGKCNRQDGTSILWSEKTPAKSVSVEDVVCPDGQSQCPDGSTCCKLSSGQYGCCPLPNAVCCADHLHCCPSGTTCDTAQGKCNRQDGTSVMWFTKTSAKKSVSVESVMCPDGQSQCPDGSTCCKLSSGQYGCCPLPNAVCCADHLHCCPSGTTCDTAQGKCNRQDGTSILWSEKTPAKSVSVEDVVCPDGQSQCPDGSTCCKLSSGQYGCCPLPNAVCCADHLHCCPSGTTCDTAQGKCNRQDGTSILWSEKTPAKSVSVEDVVCPDGQSQCPDGSTCCKLSSGQYGCCPLPNAVCCADHLHCCPSGTTCDTAQGKCNRQDGTSILWSEKTPAKSVSVEDVVCPDGQSQCPDGSTCCKLSSGQYGCCPLPNAVCCADHLHCCPSGTTCDTAQGKCNRQDGTSILWSEKTPAKSVSVEDVVCPDGQSQCPDGSTCCKLSSGQYGCCPLPNAVCCADHLHCCPSGTTCDTAQGKCNRQDGTSVLWSEKTPAKSVSVEDVVCPDGQSQCPDGSTCCKLSSGQYGCCPLPNAVCCADHLHCCPSGTTCDTAQGKCNRQDGTSVMWFTKTSAKKSVSVESVMCPDGQSQCPDGSTCCKLSSGQYGCCPLPNAVCCADHLHCCPSGTTCDTAQGKCNRQDGTSILWSEKTPAKSVSVEDVVCPDGQSQCPDGSTCCKLSSGQYGCCPLPNAVCCADHLHCCPSGTTCDTAQGKCNRQDGTSVMWFTKTSAKKSVSVESVMCPDGQSQCPDGSTCCKLSSGQYGCCPLPNAVCCADHLHCCPSGTTCDTAQGKCNRQDGTSILWSEKTPAKSVSVEDVVCPDGQSQCPDGSTCCKLSSGQYGCCPLPNAVCCADHLHCCPSGTTCDTAQGKCNRQDGTSILWSEKTPAKSVSVEDVVCPDGQSQCPDGSTCCKLSSGQYGCCPLPNAVCCADHLHCCPSGTTCDTAQGKCNRQDGTSVLWSEKTPAKSVSVESVTCPDGQSQCPDGSTCCKLSSGQYGCCPLPNAVCCADHLHCCPSGTTCDTAQGKCNRQDGTSILWSEKTPAKSVSVEDVVCPDGQSQCPDGSTCCKLSSGQYGCCPLPNAVCCADHLHCCPSGTTCDTAQGKCNRQDGTSILWSEKTPAKSVSVEDVVCPDGQSQCPDGSTCCKLSSGQYGCCPLPNAVCCADHLHCCPSGTTCDTAQGKCNRQDGTSVMWFTKTSAKKSVSVNDVMCPGGASQCPDGSTCCLLQSGQYGCCPYPKAVCCSDKLHCCPSGTTCDVAAGSCNRQDGTSILWSEKTPAKSVSVEDVVCPDGQSQCPDGSTCCKLSSGQYGCCPLPNAVCCADHLHCCPSGTTCDTAQGKCNRQDGTSVMWFTKTSAQKSGTAIQKEEVNHVDEDYSVMCPDGHSQCPDGETCCKLYSGDYGCCPLPDAVCCSDEIHCCPAGFTCDVGKQQCTDSQTSSDMVKHRPAKQSFECCGTKCCPSGYKCTRSGLCEKLPNADWKLFKNGF